MKRLLPLLPFILVVPSISMFWPIATSGKSAGDAKEPASKTEAKARKPVKLTEEALRVHRESLVIDGHNDLPWRFREKKDLSFLTFVNKAEEAVEVLKGAV